MYLGKIIEVGSTRAVVQQPKHPYTASLLSASPNVDPAVDRTRVLLPGEPPNPVNLPEGCNFAPRCPKATDECRQSEPERSAWADGDHEAACYFPVEDVNAELLDRYKGETEGVETTTDGVPQEQGSSAP
jgi:oligopeptide/dipeptide ABC transporter, ATP-binding protein, C-terminal domain